MLNKNFRYVSLDFETTGLDTKKDEVIQVGLLEIDINGKPIKEFKSFVKPQKDISEIRDLVSYITGISLEDLNGAPSIFDLKKDIELFFGDNVVLIGHNIQFDIDFIERYFPDILYYDSIDTFNMSQNLVHFAPSYALDVLVEYLMSRKEFKNIFSIIHKNQKFDVSKSHDALYDVKNSLSLFFYFIFYMTDLVKKYPNLINFVKKNTGLYHKILDLQVDRAGKKNGKLVLPSLEKQLPNDVSINSDLKIDINKFENKKRHFVGNVDINHLVQSLVSGNKNIIMSFSSIAKLNIVKNMLNSLGMKNIGFVRGQLILDKIRFKRFLNKKSYGDNELMFVFKYMSHVKNDISVLDVNTKFDYKINYYIKDENKLRNYPVILSTHGGLFSILQNEEHLYKNYGVCFFDTEMWYKGYNHYLSSPCDLYSILSFLENLYYKYTLDENENAQKILDDFARFFEVFMGVFFSETKKQFINVSNNFITINPILDSIDFFETNSLIKRFDSHRGLLESALDSIDFNRLWSKIDHMFAIISGLVQVNRRMYNQSEFYFVYSEATKFTNWDEFTDIFPSHTLFLSNYDKSYPKLLEDKKDSDGLNFKKISDMDNIVDYLEGFLKPKEEKIVFIISTVKMESKELFEKMFSRGLDQKATLLVENITGSLGKNIFKAKSNGSKIIIGGYNFMIRLLSNKISIDICVDFNIKGKMSSYLLNDIRRYAKNYKK
ncbi:MAG TPA: 3'-5' exonuclease [Candidatus Absconditabacterales bacterium]|nr:3'-5' exonuclease [Candidatus Absconditabacterales bacterium]